MPSHGSSPAPHPLDRAAARVLQALTVAHPGVSPPTGLPCRATVPLCSRGSRLTRRARLQVGTEHVLLGLVMEAASPAARRGRAPLSERGYLGLGVLPEAAHAAQAWVCGRRRRSGSGPRTPELAFSRPAKCAFEAAVQARGLWGFYLKP